MSKNAQREESGEGCMTVAEPVGAGKETVKAISLGPFTFPYIQFEKDGIIAQTNVPESQRSTLYFFIASPTLGSFVIVLYFKDRETPVQKLELKIDDLLQMQKENKHLDFESSQLNTAKVVGLLQRIFPVSAAPSPTTNQDATLPKILIHESLLSFLRGACSTRVLGRSINDLTQFQKVLDGYVLSMASSNVISAVVGSLEFRRKLMDFSSQLGLTNDPKLRAAQRADDERIATTLVSIFNSALDEDAVLRLEGDSAQHFLDVVQGALDKGFLLAEEHSRMARRMIRKLSERCDMLPSSLFIAGVSGREEHPTFGGGYGDIFRASYNEKPVALKRMRYFLRGAELRHVHLKFCREALVWKDLRHPNILAFLGIDRDSFPSTLSMVSPWMEHGTILNYLQNNGHANVDKSLYEIAQGLQYLHSRNVIHGDLRGANILVNENWNACLADFGLSKFSDATSSMTTDRGGSLYWMAPELIVPDRFGLQFARTRATDVYAFGCVCLELYTGRPPFADLREPAAMLKIANNERPQPPVGPPVMSDALWDHVSVCWAEHPQARPETQLVVQTLKSFQPLPLIPEVLTKESHSGKDPETERAEIEVQTMQQLSTECRIGVENANLLSHALARATPEELGAGVIKEFRQKCLDSQELIFTQIPWASVGAERSRAAKDAKGKQRAVRTRKTGNAVVPTLNSITPNVVSSNGIDRNANGDGTGGEVEDGGQTREEELLEDLLTTNQHLMEALAWYDDLKRVALEREMERRSRREIVLNPRLKQYMTEVLHPSHVNIGGSTSHHHSRSPSPSLAPVPVPLQPSYSGHPPARSQSQTPIPTPTPTQTLSPPRAAPHAAPAQSERIQTRTQGALYLTPDEDMRRLFTECRIGVENANLLRYELAMVTPEELDGGAIKEFHKRCLDSQELIFTQIPWASAGAERSRVAKDAELRQLQSQSPNSVNRVNRSPSAMNGSRVGGSDVEDGGRTLEEELLGDLLSANEQLMEVLALYDDLKRVALEMEASRREVVFNLDPTLRRYMPEDRTLSDYVNMGGSPAPVDDQHRENDRGRDENEITRKIGFLTATGVKDWTLVMDVCDLTIATVDTAKQAVRALRHEFKYGEPATQLAAIRLWAFMLRNSSNTFVSQCTSSKFLNTIEDLLASPHTSPVVRECLLTVLSAAVYKNTHQAFLGLWSRVRPPDKPEEGQPLNQEFQVKYENGRTVLIWQN